MADLERILTGGAATVSDGARADGAVVAADGYERIGSSGTGGADGIG